MHILHNITSYCKHEHESILKTGCIIIYFSGTIGTTKVRNLENNIGSLAVELTDEELKEISNAIPVHEVAGEREFDILYKYSWKFATTPSK